MSHIADRIKDCLAEVFLIHPDSGERGVERTAQLVMELAEFVLSEIAKARQESESDTKQILLRMVAAQEKTNERLHQIMAALERLTSSITTTGTNVHDLTVAVDDAVTHIGNPGATDAQLNTLADTVDALNATVGGQSKRLNEAVNPPPPVAPTTT